MTGLSGETSVSIIGRPGELWTAEITINAAGDCITTANAPAADGSELYLFNNLPAGINFARISYHWEGVGVPHAGYVKAAVNASGIADANNQLKHGDNTVGVLNAVSAYVQARKISPTFTVIEYDLRPIGEVISNIYLGAHLPTGTGAVPVDIHVEAMRLLC